MDEGLSGLREVLRDIDSEPELRTDDGFTDLRKFAQSGEQIRGWLVTNIHGGARPGVTPDLLSVKRAMDEWISTGNAFFASLTSR